MVLGRKWTGERPTFVPTLERGNDRQRGYLMGRFNHRGKDYQRHSSFDALTLNMIRCSSY